MIGKPLGFSDRDRLRSTSRSMESSLAYTTRRAVSWTLLLAAAGPRQRPGHEATLDLPAHQARMDFVLPEIHRVAVSERIVGRPWRNVAPGESADCFSRQAILVTLADGMRPVMQDDYEDTASVDQVVSMIRQLLPHVDGLPLEQRCGPLSKLVAAALQVSASRFGPVDGCTSVMEALEASIESIDDHDVRASRWLLTFAASCGPDDWREAAALHEWSQIASDLESTKGSGWMLRVFDAMPNSPALQSRYLATCQQFARAVEPSVVRDFLHLRPCRILNLQRAQREFVPNVEEDDGQGLDRVLDIFSCLRGRHRMTAIMGACCDAIEGDASLDKTDAIRRGTAMIVATDDATANDLAGAFASIVAASSRHVVDSDDGVDEPRELDENEAAALLGTCFAMATALPETVRATALHTPWHSCGNATALDLMGRLAVRCSDADRPRFEVALQRLQADSGGDRSA